MKASYRVFVQRWDDDRKKAVTVCKRTYRTHDGAERRINRYRGRFDLFRASIQFLGYGDL